MDIPLDVYYPISKAGIAQLVERNLAKVEVASSNLVSRSIFDIIYNTRALFFYEKIITFIIFGFASFELCF
jgi:hypothetical protein